MEEEHPLPEAMTRWTMVAWLMPRAVALCFALAFWSWGVQCLALVGEEGILPAQKFMEAVRAAELREGHSLWWQLPSVFYFHCSDEALSWACWLGLAGSFLAVMGVAQRLWLCVAWVLYLSLAVVGQDFMGFQWDALLLEAGLLAILVSGRGSRVAVFLFHWLLFRLMLESGIVKLWSGDPTWENGTALLAHFETQPLPTWIGWWAHQLPREVLVGGCWGMYVVELALPLVMWFGRWGRLLACVGYAGLMFGIALTGNYNFFNLLTALLALSLLDDSWWPTPWTSDDSLSPTGWRHWHSAMALPVVIFSLIAADLDLSARRVTGRPALTPEPIAEVYQQWVAPWRSINSYGLFQSMTTRRVEIEVEVSEDGITYFPLTFHWKPDDLAEVPGFVAPYHPRLDWQMWFVPLGGGRVPGWFSAFVQAIAEGRDSAWRLVDAKNSLVRKERVRAARSSAWHYQFTTREERAATGHWWKRSYLGPFTEAVRGRS